MDVVSPMLAILFVFGLLAGLLMLARRAATNKPLSLGVLNRRRLFSFPKRDDPSSADQKSLSVLRQATLTPSHRLHLLNVGGQQVLLCTHPQGCSVISAPDKVDERTVPYDRA